MQAYMPNPTPQDPERGNASNVIRDHSQLTPNQPPQVESNFGDSSEPIFSMYTKAAQDEDNKMVERWQKDADGIIIFSGLFSASVAALLSVTVGDLKPNSQDTSAFYLGSIYGVLADPNATRASIPSPAAKLPPFSTPKYAVWVNSLWFSSLVMSVSCALWATSLNQWARRYIRLTQPTRCSPEKRARIRAFFSNGVDKMHIPWAVEGLPMLLHLSLFLFFGGLVIYLFNVDQEVFTFVVPWIGLFSVVYGLIALLPIIRHDSPYNTPLSTPLGFLFAHILYAASIVFYITFCIFVLVLQLIVGCCFGLCCQARMASEELYEGWILFVNLPLLMKIKFDGEYSWALRAVMKKADTVEKQSPEIDGRILGWTISALDDDDSLEKFLEAMPGFFDSELVKDLKEHLPYDQLRNALAGFLGRTLSSKSLINSVKLHRLDIFMDTINLMDEGSIRVSSILGTLLFKRWDLAPQSIEVAHTLARLYTSNDQRTASAQYARCTVTRVLVMVRKRDDRWFELAARISGVPMHDLRDNRAHTGKNMILATLIDLCRQTNHSDDWKLVRAFSQFEFDICNTLPRLQHDFCTLWNEFVDKARIRGGPDSTPVLILNSIRYLYVALHPGTDAATIALSTTISFDFLVLQPSYYPLCNISSHHSNLTAHPPLPSSRVVPFLTQPIDLPDAPTRHSSSGGRTVPGQVKRASIITRPRSRSEPTTSREISESSRLVSKAISPALPAPNSPHPTDATLKVAVAALRDIPPAATLSHSLEETAQKDIVVPFGESDIGETLSTSSTPEPTPTLVPVPASTPPVLNEPSASSDAGDASASNTFLPQPASPVVRFSIPATFPSTRDLLFPNAESLALLSSTTSSRPAGNATLPRLRVRGLVNTGSMCFANAVLQLLVRSPQFWNLFKEMDDLKGQRGATGPETGGGATPLVDATVRFFEEFMFREEPPPAQQQLQQTSERNPREYEETKKESNAVDSFEPIYIYDAMKAKGQLKHLLDGQQQDAEEFFRLFVDALDEELLALLASLSGHHSATPAPGVGEREVSQSEHTDAGTQGFTAESVESPLIRIFGGRFNSTVRAPDQLENVTTEDWRSLHLDIQHNSVNTIDDALARISHLQHVELGPSGLSDSEASQKVLIEGLPPVLVVHLKRFLYDTAADGIVKISKPVWFGPELEIPLEIMTPIAAEPVHYKLYGVLYHHGGSAGSGHYTVDVLHPNEDSGGGEASSWLRINDEAVSAVRHDDVFGGLDDERVVEDRCAYMLFYCRTDLAWALA